MSNNDFPTNRRKFLTLMSSGLTAVTLAGVAGCSGDEAETKPAVANKPQSAPKPAAPEAAASAPASDLPQLKLDDPQAQALGYVHDAANVDAAKFPQRQEAHNCSNCILFQAKGTEQWAGCTIFPGKSVNAKGWCNAYAPKAG